MSEAYEKRKRWLGKKALVQVTVYPSKAMRMKLVRESMKRTLANDGMRVSLSEIVCEILEAHYKRHSENDQQAK